MKDILADALMFVALGLVTIGAALLVPAAGFIVAGLGLAGMAFRIGTKA
jgi:hypothetical protein